MDSKKQWLPSMVSAVLLLRLLLLLLLLLLVLSLLLFCPLSDYDHRAEQT